MRKLTAALPLALGLTLIVLGFTLGLKKAARDVVAGIGLIVTVVSGIELIGYAVRPKRNEPDEREDKPLPEYAVKRAYISRSEAALFELLKTINPDRYEVFPQAALVSVVDKLTMNAYRNELFRIVDFVFVDRATYAPLLLVELNDASHNKSDRIERDRKVREICERAGMPLVTLTTAESRDFGLVKKAVLKNILRK